LDFLEQGTTICNSEAASNGTMFTEFYKNSLIGSEVITGYMHNL